MGARASIAHDASACARCPERCGDRARRPRCAGKRPSPRWAPWASPMRWRWCWRALDDKPAIRRRAAIALAGFDDPAATEGLRRCLEDRDWQVRQAAEVLLDEQTPSRRRSKRARAARRTTRGNGPHRGRRTRAECPRDGQAPPSRWRGDARAPAATHRRRRGGRLRR